MSSDPKPVEVSEEKMAERRNFVNLRRLHARSLTRFQRAHKRIAARLPDTAKESEEEKQKMAVKDAYQLLRSWMYACNFVMNSDKDAPRFEMPKDQAAAVKSALGSANYAMYEAAIQATKEEFEAKLPSKITSDAADKLLKYVADNEAAHITSRFEQKITILTEQINAIKAEKPRKERDPDAPKPKKQRKRRNSDKSADKKEVPVEDQLRDVLKTVGKRSDSVRFAKDDFESLAEAQSQLDALFKETMTEILGMKQRLRQKFNRVQNRKPRNKKKD